MATPLSAIKTILSWSSLSSFNAFFSSLLMLLFVLFSMMLTSALSSCASCSGSLWHAASTTEMNSTLGGLVGAREKLGPLDRRDVWTGVRGVLNKLTTHLELTLLILEPCTKLLFLLLLLLLTKLPCTWLLLLLFSELILQLFLLSNLLNLPTCLSLIMLNLTSFTLLMSSMLCCCVVWLVSMENSLDLLDAMPALLSWRMLFTHLTLSGKSCLSALLMMFLAPILMSFLFDLSLTLTGTNPLLMHLKVNILWFCNCSA